MDITFPIIVGALFLLFLICVLLYLGVEYSRIIHYARILRQRANRAQDEHHGHASKIIESAHEKSLEILEESEEKAQEILRSADLFVNDSEKSMSEHLEKVTNEYAKAYENTLQQLQLKAANALTSVSENIDRKADDQLKQFELDIVKQTIQSTHSLEAKVSREAHAASVEMDNYKKKVMQKIDEQGLLIIKQAVFDTIKKSLSTHDQEELAKNALEAAKQSHVF